MIRFLSSPDIDRNKWDECILSSPQGLIYGLSWYLDLVTPGWCALVEDDYLAVMPLPVKKKFGFPYLVQPLFTQQLGVFSLSAKPGITREFIQHIPPEFRYAALHLNYLDDPGNGLWNTNLILSLDRPYEDLYIGYSENTQRNLRKAAGLGIRFDDSPESLITLRTRYAGEGRRRIPGDWIRSLTLAVMERSAGFVCTAVYESRDIASVFFLHHKGRIYYLIPVSSPEGKEKKAMFALVDLVIQKFAGSRMILDFEGSNLPGPSRFFRGFGAQEQPYPVLKFNRLPFPFNHIRKS